MLTTIGPAGGAAPTTEPATSLDGSSTTGVPAFADGEDARLAAEELIGTYIESEFGVTVTDAACSVPDERRGRIDVHLLRPQARRPRHRPARHRRTTAPDRAQSARRPTGADDHRIGKPDDRRLTPEGCAAARNRWSTLPARDGHEAPIPIADGSPFPPRPRRGRVPAGHRGIASNRRHRRHRLPHPRALGQRWLCRRRRVLRRLRLPHHPADPRRAGPQRDRLAPQLLGSAGPPTAAGLDAHRHRHGAVRPAHAAAACRCSRWPPMRSPPARSRPTSCLPTGWATTSGPSSVRPTRRRCSTTGRWRSRSSSTCAGRSCSCC